MSILQPKLVGVSLYPEGQGQIYHHNNIIYTRYFNYLEYLLLILFFSIINF